MQASEKKFGRRVSLRKRNSPLEELSCGWGWKTQKLSLSREQDSVSNSIGLGERWGVKKESRPTIGLVIRERDTCSLSPLERVKGSSGILRHGRII